MANNFTIGEAVGGIAPLDEMIPYHIDRLSKKVQSKSQVSLSHCAKLPEKAW
jgi:hypothetical protein